MRFLRKVSLAVVFTALLSTTLFAAPPKFKTTIEEKDIPQYLQDISVTVSTGRSTGSGVFKVTKDGQVWVWTCGHLVEYLRHEREGADKKNVVEFDDAKVLKYIVEDGRRVGEQSFDAQVVRYSDKEHGEDLALLRLRTKKFVPLASAIFYTDKEIPAIGTDLYHCGSLLGSFGSNSLTAGIMSQHGRILFNDKVFDQTTCTAFPGSSGGIVCIKKDGRYVGMLVRGAGEQFNLIVPVRRMKEWADKVGVTFAMDDTLDVPKDEELKKRPADDGILVPDSKKKKPVADDEEKLMKLIP